jgi:hypothetical protein
MPGRIRQISGRFVRLSEATLARVEHLAALAHVTTSDIVNFVLAEVFETEDQRAQAEPIAAAPRPPVVPRRSRGPADVIPITRKRGPIPSLRSPLAAQFGDLDYLRLQAADLRRSAQRLRACAVDACCRADRARASAQITLE